jgi:serine/threonine protein kinase
LPCNLGLLADPRSSEKEQFFDKTSGVNVFDRKGLLTLDCPGVILYEMGSGQNPFAGATDLETYRRQRELEAPPLRASRSGMPRDLEAIARKCLEKSPARRYADGRALADDLRHFLAGEPTRARRCRSWNNSAAFAASGRSRWRWRRLRWSYCSPSC